MTLKFRLVEVDIGWLIATNVGHKPAKINLNQSGFEPVPSKSNSHPDTWFTGVRHHSRLLYTRGLRVVNLGFESSRVSPITRNFESSRVRVVSKLAILMLYYHFFKQCNNQTVIFNLITTLPVQVLQIL